MFKLQESKIKTARVGTTNGTPHYVLETHQEINTILTLLLAAIKQVRRNLALNPKVIQKRKLELELKKKVKRKWILKKDILKEAKAVWFLQKQNERQRAISNYRVKKSYLDRIQTPQLIKRLQTNKEKFNDRREERVLERHTIPPNTKTGVDKYCNAGMEHHSGLQAVAAGKRRREGFVTQPSGLSTTDQPSTEKPFQKRQTHFGAVS